MQIGIDSFAAVSSDPLTGVTMNPSERLNNFIEEIEWADQVGVHSFGLGEHHRPEYLDSSPTIILAAAASRTSRIRLSSAVTVLSAADPVRVFQDFATLDLISRGRAEIVAGRGSTSEAFPLFGLDLNDYDSLYAEKLELLLKLRAEPHPHWSGRHRAPLTGQGVYPRPYQAELPIWVGVGGTPASFVRAGTLGLPLMMAIIGSEFSRFRPLLDLYREAGQRAGHAPEKLRVGVHAFGFVGDTTQQAADTYFPGYLKMITAASQERGWPAPTRARFDASVAPAGPFLIGSPEAVVQKLLYANEVLGGLDRVTLQMTNLLLTHDQTLHAIELLGKQVIPLLDAKLEARPVTAG